MVMIANQVEGLKVLATDEYAIDQFIQVWDVGKQTRRKLRSKVPSIHYQGWMAFQKVNCERLTVPRASQVSLNLVNGEQPHPFLPLGIAGGNLRIHVFGDLVEHNAVISFDYEFLLEP